MDKMNFDDKIEFLEFAKELAKNLEDVTNDFIAVKIGWINNLPVTIMLNHETAWFGSHENFGWNENVIKNSINDFVPVKNDYLALNELVDFAYTK